VPDVVVAIFSDFGISAIDTQQAAAAGPNKVNEKGII
jgi:hypothetical protein